jgi:bifunctional DNase/RNase
VGRRGTEIAKTRSKEMTFKSIFAAGAAVALCINLSASASAGRRETGASVPDGRKSSLSKSHSNMVRVSVRKVGTLRNKYVVLLQTSNAGMLLPIWIGAREAQAIHLARTNKKPRRPLTHNLFAATLKKLKAKIARVEIVAIKKGIFIGALVLKDSSGKVHRIDARPSDLIALAVGAGSPIYVSPSVLAKAAKGGGSGTKI